MKMKIKDIKNKTEKVEQTKEYRQSVEKSNQKLKDYEFQQALMYKRAEKFVVN